jgi:hypothetical protein
MVRRISDEFFPRQQVFAREKKAAGTQYLSIVLHSIRFVEFLFSASFPPMFHTQLHLNSTPIRTTGGKSLETFKQSNALLDIWAHWTENCFHIRFKGLKRRYKNRLQNCQRDLHVLTEHRIHTQTFAMICSCKSPFYTCISNNDHHKEIRSRLTNSQSLSQTKNFLPVMSVEKGLS